MIGAISSFTSNILCISIFVGLVQMILPHSLLKQNIIFACLVIITIYLVEPIIKLSDAEIDFDQLYEDGVTSVETQIAKADFEQNYEQMLYDTFEENVREDMITRLEKAGYQVNSVTCEMDRETFLPKYLKLEIETQDGFVQPVRIEVAKNYQEDEAISPMQRYAIKSLLVETYGVAQENILINGR